MNWQVLTKNYFRLILILTGLFSVFACEESREIGFGLVPRDEVGVFFTDTLTIETSTVLGNVNSSNPLSLLSGRYQDSDLGEIKAESYFQLVADTMLLLKGVEANTLSYDSLVLNLNFNYLYGNLSASQTFSLHELTEDIQGDVIYTNQNSVMYDPTPAYTFTLTGEELQQNPTYRIRMSDVLGQQFFDAAEGNQTRADFLNDFKGYALVSASNPGDDVYVIGLNANPIGTRMNLHYSEISAAGAAPINRILGFFLSIGDRFNQVTSDRSSTLLAGSLANTYDEVGPSDTDSLCFVQSGVGLQTKISFPSLQNLANQGNIAINRAELVIRVAPGSTEEFDEPAGLILYETDESNQILKTTVNDTEFDLIVQQEGRNPFGFDSPLVLRYNERGEEFRADITTYLQLLYTGVKSNESILISPTELNARVNRLILNAKKSSPFSMKLRVFYSVFN